MLDHERADKQRILDILFAKAEIANEGLLEKNVIEKDVDTYQKTLRSFNTPSMRTRKLEHESYLRSKKDVREKLQSDEPIESITVNE